MKFIVDGRQGYAYTGTKALVPAQPTLVFVHGGGLDHTVWLAQSRYFAHHGFNVLALDLPAHGLSLGEPLSSIGAMADWVLRALDALEVERAAFIGHSMGSLVVLEATARYPQRAWLLAMLGTAVPMAVTDQLLSAARENRHAAFDMINIWGHGGQARIGGNEAPGMWMTGSAVRLLEQSRPGVLYADLSACHAYVDGLDAAARVQCPAHLILGSRDAMTPTRVSRDLIATLGDAEVTMLPGCGHMVMAERPNEVLDALVEAVTVHAPAPQSLDTRAGQPASS